jgi:hypothetical protein
MKHIPSRLSVEVMLVKCLFLWLIVGRHECLRLYRVSAKSFSWAELECWLDVIKAMKDSHVEVD